MNTESFRWLRFTACAVLLTATVLPAQEAADRGRSGFDLWTTVARKTKYTFNREIALPAGFFAEGSQRFTGTVLMKGVPIKTFRGHEVGSTDTVVERKDMPRLQGPFPRRGTAKLELAALSLQSIEPIKVRVGRRTELWDVKASVSPSRPSQGQLDLTQRDERGGVAKVAIEVYPLLVFTRRGDQTERQLDVGKLTLSPASVKRLTLRADDVAWALRCPPRGLVVQGLNDSFCAGSNLRPNGLTDIIITKVHFITLPLNINL